MEKASPLSPWSASLAENQNSALQPRKINLSEAVTESSDVSADHDGQPFGEATSSAEVTGASTAAAALEATLAFSSSSSSSDHTQHNGGSSSSSGPPAATEDLLTARIVATSNQLEEEPWLPVRSIVTMYRIQATCGGKQWEVMRRYSDFAELHLRLSKALDASVLPSLPPKLLMNEDTDIASRYLELDAYLRGLLASPATQKHGKLLDFLGAEKHGVRYGVRRYEYDSASSEGNKYIRDDEL